MKFVALTVVSALALTGVTAVKGYFTLSNTPSETVLVKSASVSGNILDTRLNGNKDNLVVLSKNVLKLSVDYKRVLYLDEEVTAQASQRIANSIKQLQDSSAAPIYLLIDSPGGSVIDGAAVISEMEVSRAPVYTVCTRLCASMAAMIHSYGAKRYVTDRSILMYHPASGGSQGQVPNMLSQLTTLTRYLNKMVANIVARSKVSKDEYEKLTAYELWVDAEDALQRGLADSIVNLNVPDTTPQLPQAVVTPDAPDPDHQAQPKVKPFNFSYISPYLDFWK